MSSSDSKISIIMSVYNETINELEKSVKSILNQTYKNIQFVVIIDNPQHKEAIDFLTKLSCYDERLCVYINNKNIGLVDSLNIALNKVDGEYIARMDADDISNIERLEKQKNFLEKNNYDLIGSSVNLIGENDEFISIMSPPSIQLNKAIKFKTICFHPTWFGKRTVFNKLNGYRNIKYVEDYDFLLRAIKQGVKISNIGEPLLHYRIRRNSISNSNFIQQIENSNKIRKVYNNNNNIEDYFIYNKEPKDSMAASIIFHSLIKSNKQKKSLDIFRYSIILILIKPSLLMYLLRQLYAKFKFK